MTITTGEPIGRRRIVKWILFLVRLFGLWLPNGGPSALYVAYQIALHSIFSFLYALALCIRMAQLRTATELIAASGMTLTVLALLVKFVNVCHHHRTVARIVHEHETFVMADDGERRFVDSRMKFFTTVAIGYYLMANSAGASSFVAAALTKSLPFYGSYPFDWQHEMGDYWLVYGYQVAGMFILCNANVTIELLPGYLMFLTSVRLELLSKRLCALNGHSTRGALLRCIKVHKNLLR